MPGFFLGAIGGSGDACSLPRTRLFGKPHAQMYRVFGLAFRSFIPLPELTWGADDRIDVDVEIRREVVSLPSGAAASGQECEYATETEAWFYWEDAGAFLVREGREILVDVPNEVDPAVLRRYLLGPVLAMVLHQRGMLVLHGSAVVIHGAAAAFLGDSGAGKSTTAAALYRRGHRLLADDIVAIDLSREEVPVLVPGFAELNLWPDATAAVDLPGVPVTRHEPGRAKRAFHAGASALEPVPVHCVYQLVTAATICIEDLPPALGLIQFFNHSFGPVLRRFGLGGAVFERCAEATRRIPLRRLSRTDSLAQLGELMQVIEENTLYPARTIPG